LGLATADIGFIIWDVVSALPTGGAGVATGETVRATLKGTVKTAIKNSHRALKQVRKYADDVIEKSITFASLGGKARGINEISTVLSTTRVQNSITLESLIKKGWDPISYFASLSSRAVKSTKPIKLTEFQKKLLKNSCFDWAFGFVLIESLQSDAAHTLVRKMVVLKEEAARVSQIHLNQLSTWLRIQDIKG
jgi:hypothetical protein